MENKQKTILLLILGLAVIAATVWLLIFIINSLFLPKEVTPDNYLTDFPSVTSDNTVNGVVSDTSLNVSDVFGDQVGVNNFIEQATTVTDPVNQGVYILAGDPGFCLADGSCPKAYNTDQFLISYSERDSFFSVLLLQEPIKESRAAATDFLRTSLGISDDKLCDLNMSVSVPQWINEFYAGEELRLSGCPDSVPLE